MWLAAENRRKGQLHAAALPENERPTPRRRPRVLAVDDQPDILDLLGIVLGEEGFDVEMATGGAEALERLADAVPDLVLLDLVMPTLDGWEVLRRMSGAERTLPTLVLTARRDSDAFLRAFRAGATGYVVKPFDLEELVDTCRLALGARPRDVARVPDRRSEPRRPFLVRVTLRADGGQAGGVLTELSPGGARVVAGVEHAIGDAVTIDANLTRGAAPLSVAGRVVWRSYGVSDSTYGLRLDREDPASRANLLTLFPEAG